VAVPGRDTRGIEHLDPEDIVLPQVRIVQPSGSGDGLTAGEFVSDSDSVQMKELTCVFVIQDKSRAMFQDGALVCRSANFTNPDNGVNPDGEMVLCGECSYAQWTTDPKTNKRKPPQCGVRYNLLGVHDDVGPFNISFHGMSSFPARRFLSLFISKGRPLFSARVTVTLDKQQNAKGTFYVAKFGQIQWLTPEEMAPYEEMYSRFRSYGLGATADVPDVDGAPGGPAASAPQGSGVGEEEVPF
jgi:hypothetical protein